MNTLPPRLLPAPAIATLALLCLGAGAAAQVTDPAVIASYGPSCGVGLTATDTVQADGSHALQFQVAVAPNGPALLAFGLDAANFPIPGSLCQALLQPIDIAFAPANAFGVATFNLPLPAATVGRFYLQAATLDQNLAIQTSSGRDVLLPGQSPTPDPTTLVDYPCAYFQDLTWNYGNDGVGNVQGRVWWPSATCQLADGPPNGLPMVIFLHGNGMTFTDHDAVLERIARNGFVVCSVGNGAHLGGSNEGRAREAISYLNGMHAFWSYRNRLTTDVAFAGHSRGGEAAITATRLLRDNPSMQHVAYDVDAVAAIAPTDGGGDGSDPRESLAGDMSPGLLLIYGTHDEDVRGQAWGTALLEPERTPFAIYDRAGNEASTEGLLLPANNVSKSLIFVEGATHTGFLDTCNPLLASSLSCASHREVAVGYFNAFLRWRVRGQAAYRSYLTGEAVPTTLRVDEVTTWPLFQAPRKRVVDNFEQGGWSVNTLGGTVQTAPGIVHIAEGEARVLESSCPHDTQVLRVRWSGQSSLIWFQLPATAIAQVGPTRNVSSYQYLSIRVAQDYTDVFNTPGVDQNFKVFLFSGGQNSFPVDTADYGGIPFPTYFYTDPPLAPAGDFTKTAMRTFRIPLSRFLQADLTDVSQVLLQFSSIHPGAILIDSIEFTD